MRTRERGNIRRRMTTTEYQLRAAPNGDTIVDGYAAVFNQPAYSEVIRDSAFNRTLAQRDDVRFLVNHAGIPLARTKSGTLKLSTDQRGLYDEAQIQPLKNPTAAELVAAIERGDLDQQSFSFEELDGGFTDQSHDLWEVREVVLWDVSAVTFPWYETTSMGVGRALEGALRSLAMGAPMDPEQRRALAEAAHLIEPRDDHTDRHERKAIASHSTPTVEAAWDGSAMKTNCLTDQDPSYFAKVFAWSDPNGDPRLKTSYKFVHHMVSADGTPGAANIQACVSGCGVLNGGMGGTTIPDADRDGVYAHLARHIKDAGATPPELKGAPVTPSTRQSDSNVAQLANSIDAILDSAQGAASSGDMTTVLSLLTGAEETCDSLLEALGIAEPEDDTEPPGMDPMMGLSLDLARARVTALSRR